MKNISIPIFLLLAFLGSKAILASAPSYNQLHPAIMYSLFEKNGFRPVSDQDLNALLPIEVINMITFEGITDLEILHSTPNLKQLRLSLFLEDFSALEQVQLEYLEYLDVSFSFVDEITLENSNLPVLKVLNVSATALQSLDFVENFPVLEHLIVVKHQFEETILNDIRKSFPDLQITYNSNIKPISRHYYMFEFEPYMETFLTYFATARRSGYDIVLQFEVDASGFVNNGKRTGSLRNRVLEPTKVLDLLVFEPLPKGRQHTDRVFLPIEVK